MVALMCPRPIGLQSLVAKLTAVPGVDRVIVDDRGTVAVVICQPSAAREEIAAAAATSMESLGLSDIELEFVVRSEHRRAKRIRFVSVAREERPDRTIELKVHLEWNGVDVVASARAEPGEAPEFRGVAMAAVEAVSRIIGYDLELRVAGVKQVHSFDTDLMVASLHRTAPPRQQLVGAVIAGDDPHSAACKAVLNALNRVLGNYLAR
jgi:hypothetical protein